MIVSCLSVSLQSEPRGWGVCVFWGWVEAIFARRSPKYENEKKAKRFAGLRVGREGGVGYMFGTLCSSDI